jgi:hypothetical protein
MGDIFQRNSMALGASGPAPISLGQFGVPRPDTSMTSPMNTAGGLPLPELGAGAPVNLLSPTELTAMHGFPGVGSRSFNDLRGTPYASGILAMLYGPQYLRGQFTPPGQPLGLSGGQLGMAQPNAGGING